MIDLGAMVADCSGCTAPMPQQTLAHALHMAAAMRVRAPMPRLSPVPVAPRVQQPAAMRAPAPMPRRSGFTASLLLSLTFFVAAAAALAGALYF
jgi:ferric-dicitrate binding protein FerR (iron transport regulator)